jgi:hypothetical protein
MKFRIEIPNVIQYSPKGLAKKYDWLWLAHVVAFDWSSLYIFQDLLFMGMNEWVNNLHTILSEISCTLFWMWSTLWGWDGKGGRNPHTQCEYPYALILHSYHPTHASSCSARIFSCGEFFALDDQKAIAQSDHISRKEKLSLSYLGHSFFF